MLLHVVGFHPIRGWVAFWCVHSHHTYPSLIRFCSCFHFFAFGTGVNVGRLMTLPHTDIIPFGCLPSSQMLDHILVLFFIIWKMIIQFFIMLVQTYSCSKSVQVFPLVYILAKTFFSSFSFVVVVASAVVVLCAFII